MSDRSNIDTSLKAKDSAMPSDFPLGRARPAAGARDSEELPFGNHAVCRCCLKVNIRSNMLGDQFCDTECWYEFERNGCRIVAQHIDNDISVCCCCGREVLVMVDGCFLRILAYRCIECRSNAPIELSEVEQFPKANKGLPLRLGNRGSAGSGH